MDRYLHEGSKLYRDCEVQNNAYQNSLERKNLGLELERRKTTLYLSREEHQLREQLKQMQIAKTKTDFMVKGTKDEKRSSPVEIVKKIPTEPYPVTFSSNSPSPVDHGKHLEKDGRIHGFKRRRKLSKEFEDVSLETGSRSLFSLDGHDFPRRRVNSMTTTQKPNFGLPPKTSQGLRRTVLDSRLGRGVNSRGSSRESLNDNSITSLDSVH